MGIEELLADAFAGYRKSGPFGDVCQAIEKGRTSEIPASDIEDFIENVLAPLKNPLEKILASPRAKNILECKTAFCSEQELAQLDVASLSIDQSFELIARAIMRSADKGEESFVRFREIECITKRQYQNNEFFRSCVDDFFNESAPRRKFLWMFHFLSVGVAEKTGDASIRLLPLKKAAEAAKSWLLSSANKIIVHEEGYEATARR